jgi:hypothetical protein
LSLGPLVLLFSLKHYVSLGRFGLSCLGPLVLLFSLKHYVTLGRFGLSFLSPLVLLFSLKHYVTLGRFGLSCFTLFRKDLIRIAQNDLMLHIALERFNLVLVIYII